MDSKFLGSLRGRLILSFGMLFILISGISSALFYVTSRDMIIKGYEKDLAPILAERPLGKVHSTLYSYTRTVQYTLEMNRPLKRYLSAGEQCRDSVTTLLRQYDKKLRGLNKEARIGVVTIGAEPWMTDSKGFAESINLNSPGFFWVRRLEQTKRHNFFETFTEGGKQKMVIAQKISTKPENTFGFLIVDLNKVHQDVVGQEEKSEDRNFLTDYSGNLISYNKDKSGEAFNLIDISGLGEKANWLLEKSKGNKDSVFHFKYEHNGVNHFVHVRRMQARGMFFISETTVTGSLGELFRRFIYILLAQIVLLLGTLFGVYRLSLQFSEKFDAVIGYVKSISKGRLDGKLKLDQKISEFRSLQETLQALVRSLRRSGDFARDVGAGKLETDYNPSKDNELGKALLEMRNSLKEAKEREDRERMASEGLSRIAEILRSSEDFNAVADKLASFLAKYVNANQFGLFVMAGDDETDAGKLVLRSCYAYEKKRFTEKSIMPGQGLVGTCYLEARPIRMSEVPDGYTSITSGLGESTPTYILLIPLKVNDEIAGVMELAFFQHVEDYILDFLTRCGEAIAATVTVARNNERTKRLLEEMRQQAVVLKEKEEAARQSWEEMQAIQEDFASKERGFRAEIGRLKAELREA
ncbi:hypothetical protein FUAX_03980 [Fulvitalea axinellae]|uniref:GAF domain-containing protein n=1 Tax=Fulvitalea axinellae TaxID=1182444 RepID=A0AAU9CGS3_9BACT|nr:hypothetical protein FUAX_03980 [Fulvitalea axinellae]